MAVEYFLVPGVVSQRCVRTISEAVESVAGVLLVTVSLADKRVRVEHDGRANVEVLIEAIRRVGYEQVMLLA
jgi:copper chaperone CopZ